MRRLLAALGTLMLLCSAMPWASPPQEREKAATAAAEKWLALVDQVRYAESWREGSEVFHAAMTSEQWEQAVPRVRKPLGKMVSRALASATYRDDLPDGPKGEYVVVRFKTTFEHRAESEEKVTLKLEKDGAWRVSGYFIH